MADHVCDITTNFSSAPDSNDFKLLILDFSKTTGIPIICTMKKSTILKFAVREILYSACLIQAVNFRIGGN